MKRYVVWLPSSRQGDFEFLCCTQKNWTASKRQALLEAQELVEEYMGSVEPSLSREEAINEMGEPVVYELSIKKIK